MSEKRDPVSNSSLEQVLEGEIQGAGEGFEGFQLAQETKYCGKTWKK